jgi:hypothetical protein
MTKVKRLGVLSVANILGILYAIIGLILGLFIALFSTLGSTFGGDFDPLGFGLGFFSIIVFPILYGVMGWIGGVISAGLYNLVAKWVGGIQVELEQ